MTSGRDRVYIGAGGSPEADASEGGDGAAVPARRSGDAVAPAEPAAGVPARRLAQPEVAFVAVVCGLATLVFGVWPDPLFDLARDAGAAIASLV